MCMRVVCVHMCVVCVCVWVHVCVACVSVVCIVCVCMRMRVMCVCVHVWFMCVFSFSNTAMPRHCAFLAARPATSWSSGM